MQKLTVLLFLLLLGSTSSLLAQQVDYTFSAAKPITLDMVHAYLDRSAIVTDINELYPGSCYAQECPEQVLKMHAERTSLLKFVEHAKPKVIAGVGCWDVSQYLMGNDCRNWHMKICQEFAATIHAKEGCEDIILGASLDEVISSNIKPSGTHISIPAGLLAEFNRYNQQLFDGNPAFPNLAYPTKDDEEYPLLFNSADIMMTTSNKLVDINKDMAQLWYFFLAKNYIEAGYEMLRFGQVDLTGKNDSNHSKTYRLTRIIREYAKTHARRSHVLFNGGRVYYQDSICVFDVVSAPLRIQSEGYVPQKGGDTTAHDYGGRICESAPDYTARYGGRTAYFGSTAQVPIFFEFDNTGPQPWATTASSSIAPQQNILDACFPWGWDEITWFTKQSTPYQNRWLNYAYHKVKELANGHLAMPLRRPITEHDPASSLPLEQRPILQSLVTSYGAFNVTVPTFDFTCKTSSSRHHNLEIYDTIVQLWSE
ncbi:hypothetical protein [Hymenobacter wooponensis]|uniref:Uncharacterized protein n=1 Tax=Hymenobacter wooponensis TaxID=1525360 RepID=A0A4Z0MMW9_9BACT|nr:hypothetical protein [Hymenobacter wooponensis]TGD80750.1 hypothetical protein EU557_13135 [Hymenobacter wooponensis]